MYIEHHVLYIWSFIMALQVANPVVVAKAERMAKATGMTKTAVVEKANDRLARKTQRGGSGKPAGFVGASRSGARTSRRVQGFGVG
jgi:hypothetical protein